MEREKERDSERDIERFMDIERFDFSSNMFDPLKERKGRVIERWRERKREIVRN